MQANKKGFEVTEKEIEEAWVNVLADVYSAVNWTKMRKARSSNYDVFEHRLSFSRYEKDVPSLLNRLCNSLSLQAPELPLEDINFLRRHESVSMRVVRRMPKLLTLEAAGKRRN